MIAVDNQAQAGDELAAHGTSAKYSHGTSAKYFYATCSCAICRFQSQRAMGAAEPMGFAAMKMKSIKRANKSKRDAQKAQKKLKPQSMQVYGTDV